MKPFHILLLSAGSLLGQNILDSLENRRSKVRVTGVNSESRNPRIYRCDKAYKSPLLKSGDFKDFITGIIKKEQPDMILPGRDADTIMLAELSECSPELRSLIPGGTLNAAHIMNNKWESYKFALKYGLKFAPSILPDLSDPAGVFNWAASVGFPIMSKPIEGFGSNGIRILCNESDLSNLIDAGTEGLLLQKILGYSEEWLDTIKKTWDEANSGIPFFSYLPEENQYSSQAVIHPDGTVGKLLTCKNRMIIGRCEEAVVCSDPDFIRITEDFAASISAIGWRGMFNLQCRKTESGFYGFEMNGRMSGSTSARGWLGFDEIRELIKAFYNRDIGPDSRYQVNSEGIVFRSLTDYFTKEKDIKELNEHGVWIKRKPEREILITGSTGYLGRKLTDRLLRDDRCPLSLITGDIDKAKELYGDKISRYYTREDLKDNRIKLNSGMLIHCGFARPHTGEVQMASSLQFTSDLFSNACSLGIGSIINISSKSVYSPENTPPFTENSVPGPDSVYGAYKFSSELLLRSVLHLNTDIMGTSIRLATICGAGESMADVFVLSKFIIRALKGEKIVIRGGKQQFDIIDINDAASAISSLTEVDDTSWQPFYNLGSDKPYAITDLAELSVAAVAELNGGIRSEIVIDDSEEIYLENITESSLFRKDFSWEPKVSIEETVRSMAEQYLASTAI